VIISTIPADRPIDSGMREVMVALLRHPGAGEGVRVLLEMAYVPRHTPLMQLAEDSGWQTIPGLEVLSAQGWYQVRDSEYTRRMFCKGTCADFLAVSTLDRHQAALLDRSTGRLR
jgi:hypothetical protein